MSSAIAVEETANKKTGPVSVTMASQASCPDDCVFKDNGCYAQSGPSGIHTARLNKSEVTSPDAIAVEEANAIRKLSGSRPLRLHIVGDCSTPVAAAILASATSEYKHPVWTYTHAWRKIARRYWGKINVLASCETFADAARAMKKGYAAAVVVPEFASTKTYTVGKLRVIPCPQQTSRTSNCTTCRLCWDTAKLRSMNAVIAFAPHGARSKTVLRVLGQPA